MCEIFVVLSTNNQKLPKSTIEGLLKSALASSPSNPDGWGAFWERSDSHGFRKSDKAFRDTDIPKILQSYRGSRFFAFHTRHATSKVCYENSHPFTLSTFRGCHNGVLHDNNYHNNGSDSLDMMKTIQSSPGETLDKKILSAMSSVEGTYSVLLHAFNENKLYYFRNTPQFTFLLDKTNHLIYGATKIERIYNLIPKLHGFFSEHIKRDPHEDSVYSIDLSNGYFQYEGTIHYKPKPYSPPTSETQPSTPSNNPQPLSGWGYKKAWQEKVYGGKRGD